MKPRFTLVPFRGDAENKLYRPTFLRIVLDEDYQAALRYHWHERRRLLLTRPESNR